MMSVRDAEIVLAICKLNGGRNRFFSVNIRPTDLMLRYNSHQAACDSEQCKGAEARMIEFVLGRRV